MRSESYDFLKSIEETPSVSGYEQPVARIVRKRMGKFADTITTDVHGNVIVGLNVAAAAKGAPKVMLAGHMDQIGVSRAVHHRPGLHPCRGRGWDR